MLVLAHSLANISVHPVALSRARSGKRDMAELRFDGKVAVVTGAARGLGRAHALLLAERGAQVVVNDVGVDPRGDGGSPEPAREVAELIRERGGVAFGNAEDVSTEDGAARLIGAAISRFGRLDIVVNNAGIALESPLAELSLTEFQRMVQVHAGGSFNVTKAAWPHLVAQRYGRVVMTTSTAIFGVEQVAYAAAKGAVLGLTRSFSILGAGHNVLVNSVNPGAFTRLADATYPEGDPRREVVMRLKAELVSPVVGWLAHESCSVTGAIFECRAGHVARVFLGLTDGIRDPDLTMERIEQNVDRILATATFDIPADLAGVSNWLESHAGSRFND